MQQNWYTVSLMYINSGSNDYVLCEISYLNSTLQSSYTKRLVFFSKLFWIYGLQLYCYCTQQAGVFSEKASMNQLYTYLPCTPWQTDKVSDLLVKHEAPKVPGISLSS